MSAETSPHARTFAVRLIPVDLLPDLSAFPADAVKDGRVEVKFAKVSPRQRSEYLSRMKDRRRAELLEDLKASALPPDQVFVELDTLRETVYGLKQWIDFLNSPEGQAEVIRDSLKKHHPAADAEAVQDAVEAVDFGPMELISEICKVPLTKPGQQDAPAGNPQTPTGTSPPPAETTTTGSTPQP
jgi:hypothetical protein